MSDQDPGSVEGTVDEDFLLASEAQERGIHPAWNEILEAVPEEYRDTIRPALEKWDQGVSKRFQKIHKDYEPLKDFKEYNPEQLQMGLELIQRIEQDPRAVYDLMAQTYGFDEANETQSGGNAPAMTSGYDFDGDVVDPKLAAALEEQQRLLAELQQQQQQLAEAQENEQLQAELDVYIESLHDEYGDFDEDYVITLLANGVDGNEAVERFQEIVENAQNYATQAPQAPTVMGAGGNLPSNNIDPTKLDSAQTKDLVAQILQQSLGQG